MSRLDAHRTGVRIWRGTRSKLRDCQRTSANLGTGRLCFIVSVCHDVVARSFKSMLEAVHVSQTEPSD